MLICNVIAVDDQLEFTYSINSCTKVVKELQAIQSKTKKCQGLEMSRRQIATGLRSMNNSMSPVVAKRSEATRLDAVASRSTIEHMLMNTEESRPS